MRFKTSNIVLLLLLALAGPRRVSSRSKET